jgi:hydroxymethylpyrimidine/phosphomethylpyrimidine kinase
VAALLATPSAAQVVDFGKYPDLKGQWLRPPGSPNNWLRLAGLPPLTPEYRQIWEDIQADLKAFAAVGVHGTSVLTCITAQNPRSVKSVEACSVRSVRDQLRAVFEDLRPAAAKTGMLYSAEIIRVVADFFGHSRGLPLVVDPVMISTSGTPLLKPNAIKVLLSKLFPITTLVMPNLAEAATILNRPVKSLEDMRWAARELHDRFGCAALVKGGHLRGYREAADIFYDGREELLLTAPFIRGVRTHGTGCTYSAAITGYLARGLTLVEAVKRAKEFVTQAIAGSRSVGRHSVLGNFQHF